MRKIAESNRVDLILLSRSRRQTDRKTYFCASSRRVDVEIDATLNKKCALMSLRRRSLIRVGLAFSRQQFPEIFQTARMPEPAFPCGQPNSKRQRSPTIAHDVTGIGSSYESWSDLDQMVIFVWYQAKPRSSIMTSDRKQRIKWKWEWKIQWTSNQP